MNPGWHAERFRGRHVSNEIATHQGNIGGAMSPPGVTPEALALLEAYTFPGTNDNKHIKGGACRQCS